MDKSSFYDLIRSGQPENCMIALEIASALAREDRFFVDFKIAVDLALKYSKYEYYENIKIEFLHYLSRGGFNISKFKKKSFPAEWYTIAELVDRLAIDYYGGEKLPEGFEIFNKTKELSIYVRSDTTIGEEVAGMTALEHYIASAEKELKISSLIANADSIKVLDLYSESDYIILPEEIKNLKTLESLKLRSSFEGILLKELKLKQLFLNLNENKYSSKRAISSVKRLVDEDSLPPMLEQLNVNFYGSGNFNKFIQDKIFKLENLTHLHLQTSDGLCFEFGDDLLGLKNLKNAFFSRINPADIDYFGQLPKLESIEIGWDLDEKVMEKMQEKLIEMGSKAKIFIQELPF